jgi:membrane protein implicated in regulation of membrane protease activity
MYLTYKSVAEIERKARRYSFVSYTRSQTINERKRSHRVLIQGLLYSLALFLVNVFLTIIIGLARFGIRRYALNLLAHAFWPLQGFFNALIYSIPNFQRMYTRYRQRKKEKIRKGSNNKSSTNIGEKFPLALDEINEVVIDEEEGKKVHSEEEKEEIVKTSTPVNSSAGILSDQAEGNAEYNYFDTDGIDNNIDDYIAISLG